MIQRTIRKRSNRTVSLEQFEPRQCLSGIGLTAHLVAENDTNQPNNIRLADMDGDSDLDFITGSSGDHKIAWLENSGDGVIAAVNTIDAEPNVTSVFEISDVDGDGDSDVVYATDLAFDQQEFGQAQIVWRANDGSGGFGPQQIVMTEDGFIRRIKLADFDGDGDNDVVSLNRGSGDIGWHTNMGDGFAEIQVFATTEVGNPRSVQVGDLDGDNDVDVVVRFRHDAVEWFENDGSGDFSTSHIVESEVHPLDIALVDMDGDGDLDLLTEQGWRANDGAGNFDLPLAFADLRDVSDTEDDVELDAADFDGDGDPDVVLSEGNFINWYENTGEGELIARENVTTRINDGNFVFPGIALSVGDLNGDAKPDIVSASSSDNRIAWYQNNGGGFESQQVLSTTLAWITSTDVTDFDGDGDFDIVSAASDDQTLAWYPNVDGVGEFGPQQVISDQLNGLEFVELEDLNGDGSLDLYYAAFQQDKVAWQPFSSDDQTFGAERVITDDSDGVFSARIGDLDGDGNVDVLTTSWLDAQIAWHKGDGEGNFGPRQTILDIKTSIWPDLGDVDGDGDLDLLVTAREEAELLYLQNNGGSFDVVGAILVDFEDAAASLQNDIDADGDVDLLVSQAGNFSWYENIDGEFPTQHVIAEDFGGRIFNWDVNDFDNDGDLDVVITSGAAGKSAWFENLGAGSFGPEQLIGSGLGLENVDMHDVDGDGDQDLLANSLWEIYWFESDLVSQNDLSPGDTDGDGIVSFSDFLVLSANFGQQDALHSDGDFDGDGEVSFADFLILSSNFGDGNGQAALELASDGD